MFDIGWSEMAVIALLTLLVIGPKELPRVLRTVGQWVRKAQSLAREFQRGLDDMAREADLEDAKKLVDAGRSIANPKKMVMDSLDPGGSVTAEAKDLQAAVTADKPSSDKGDKADEPAKADTPAETKTETPAATKAPAKSATKAAAKLRTKTAAKTTTKSAAKPKTKPETAAAGTAGNGAASKTA